VATNSVFKCVFHLENGNNKMIAGPYTAYVGVAAGTRGDTQTHSLATTVAAAISSNLQSILQLQVASSVSAPGGTVVLDTFVHAQTPEVFT